MSDTSSFAMKSTRSSNFFHHLNSTWYKNNQQLRNFSDKWHRFHFDDSIAPEQYGEVQFAGRIWSIPALIDADAIVVGCWDHSLHCLDLETFEPRWTLKTGGPIYSSPAVLPDGGFVIGCEDGKLRLVSKTGLQLWEFGSEGAFHSTPTIDLSRRVVYAGSYDHHMYAVDLDTGALRWALPLDPEVEEDVYSSPALSLAGNIIFGSGMKLLSVTPTGEISWEIEALGRFTGTAALDYARGVGVVGTAKCGVIYVFRIGDGAVLSTLYTEGQVVSSPTLDFNGIASVGSNDGVVYGIDLEDGSTKWRCSIGHEFRWTPFSTLPSGRAVFVAVDELVHCVDPSTGHEVWTLAMNGGAHSAPLITPSGRMIVGSHRATLHLFRWH